jgi:hypothetical protein
VTQNSVLRKIVYGAIKFERRKGYSKRQRTAFGVETNALLDDIAALESDSNSPGAGLVGDRELEIARKHVEEVAGDKVLAEIIIRQIQGEKVADLATEFGLDVRRTQVWVSRLRQSLGLPARRRDRLPR